MDKVANALNHKYPRIINIFVLVGALAFDSSLLYGETRFRPSLVVGAIYTDNVTLASTGNEVSDLIGQVAPGFSFISEGSNSNIAIDYVMENLYYRDNDQFDNTYHQARLVNSNEVIDDIFFLDLRALHGQTTISPEGRVSFDNISVTGNRTDITTYEVSPYVYLINSNDIQSVLKYRFITNSYDDETLGGVIDNTIDEISFNIGTVDETQKFTWKLNYIDQDIDYENQRNVQFQNIFSDFGYALDSSVRVLLGIGYEDNNYVVPPGVIEPKGEYWNVGLKLTPSRRTTAELRFGDRYFGNTYDLAVEHVSRRTTLGAEYHRQPGTQSTASRIPGLAAGTDDASETDVAADSAGDVIFIDSEVFISERFDLSYLMEGIRNTVNLTLYHVNNLYQTVDRTDTFYGFDFNIEHSLTRITSLEMSLGWQNREFKPDNREDEIRYLRAALLRNFGRTLTGSVELSTLSRDSNLVGAGYDQNIIKVSLKYMYE